jgi:hypothetical protein
MDKKKYDCSPGRYFKRIPGYGYFATLLQKGGDEKINGVEVLFIV